MVLLKLNVPLGSELLIIYSCLISKPTLTASPSKTAVVVVSLYHNWFNPLDLEKSSRYFNNPNILVA